MIETKLYPTRLTRVFLFFGYQKSLAVKLKNYRLKFVQIAISFAE